VRTRRPRLVRLSALLAAAGIVAGCGSSQRQPAGRVAPAPATVAQAGPVPPQGIRLSGTVEAIHARTVIVPRLAGQISPTLVITRLVKSGTMVKIGDLILELDPQDQVRTAMDKRAELIDLDDQIQKKRSDQAGAFAADDTAMALAEHDLQRAQLENLKNDLLAKVEVEKNMLALEQAQAKLNQLKSTVALKRKAADADVRILEIRRERSERALKYAENNVTLMAVRATFAGIVVLKTTYKGSTQSEITEGDEVRPGNAVMDIIDPQAMQVRARVNQADIGLIATGQTATVRLDAYPELSFTGHVELIAPLGIPSNMTPTVRNFIVLVPINGTHPRLMPDLTASVDVGPVAEARLEKK
jgi:multidrug efflux pump subunit AcrA (membrane-fusion protein)